MPHMREPQFNVRMPQELKDRLAALAEKNKRSMNAEIIASIELALQMNANPTQHLPTDILKMLEEIISKELSSGVLKIEEVMDRLDQIEESLNKKPT